jgi:hypothetical protein
VDLDGLFARAVPEPNTGCYLWTGHLNQEGYGAVHYLGRKLGVHRVAWMIVHGAIPAGEFKGTMIVRHRCDTPACINPDHLQLGAHADNTADAVRRGRYPSGARHWHFGNRPPPPSRWSR